MSPLSIFTYVSTVPYIIKLLTMPYQHKAVVLATAATVLAVPLFSQPASWNHTICKFHVYLVRDITITL